MIIDIEKAAGLLEQGEIVAVPTDTVYGLAASLRYERALLSLFQIKNRPFNNPLNLLISSLDQARSLGENLPPEFFTLAKAFWPGSLTLVVPANKKIVPEIVRAGLDTIGLRMPNYAPLLTLINRTGPLAVPSANKSGKPTSTRKEHVLQDFGNDFPILEGECRILGIESTILVYEKGAWRLTRQGSLSAVEIESVIHQPIKAKNPILEKKGPLDLPGARLICGKGDYSGTPPYVIGYSKRVYPGAQKVYILGDLEQPEEVASHFYAVLRELENDRVSAVWFDANIPDSGILAAILDRVRILSHS